MCINEPVETGCGAVASLNAQTAFMDDIKTMRGIHHLGRETAFRWLTGHLHTCAHTRKQ